MSVAISKHVSDRINNKSGTRLALNVVSELQKCEQRVYVCTVVVRSVVLVLLTPILTLLSARTILRDIIISLMSL